MNAFILAVALLLAPVIHFEKFYGSVRADGLTFTEEMKTLEGKRVQLRGYAVGHPRVEGGLFLSRYEHEDPHGVDEHDLPFDAVGVLWRKGLELPPIPRRPTIEGVLRLGNRTLGDSEIVTVTLEDATPVYVEADGRP